MKKLVITLIVTALAAATSFSQDLPLGAGRLRAEAISQARELEYMLYADVAPQSGYDYKVWAAAKASPEIATMAQTLKPKLTTSAPQDVVYSYVRVVNKDGDALFWAYTAKNPEKVDGKWVLPASAAEFDMEFSGLPYSFDKAVASARLLVRNEYGYYDSTDVGVNGKKIYLTEGMESVNGIVQVMFADGTTKWFSTQTGAALPTVDLTPTVSMGFANVFWSKDQASVTHVITTVERYGEQPTFEIIKSAAGAVTFSVTTSEGGKRPIAYWVKHPLATKWERIEIPSPASVAAFDILLNAGVTYVVPEWSPTDFIQIQPPGKG